MGRPSVKNIRTEEILDAFERCILREGMGHSVLETIAAEAEMQRSILRHYIGNRDEIIMALCERWMARHRSQWALMVSFLPEQGRVDELLDTMFSEKDMVEVQSIIVGEAIFAEAKRLSVVLDQVSQWRSNVVNNVLTELQHEYPQANAKACQSVAHGVMGMYLTMESFIPLGLDLKEILLYRNAAKRLVASLDV